MVCGDLHSVGNVKGVSNMHSVRFVRSKEFLVVLELLKIESQRYNCNHIDIKST